jgi:hypothetical protein
MNTAGVYVENFGFAPVGKAKTLRIRNGKTVTTNGPFAETTEELGGYFLLDCKDIDGALSWAAKIPYANGGSIEVRPVIAYTEDMVKKAANDEAYHNAVS